MLDHICLMCIITEGLLKKFCVNTVLPPVGVCVKDLVTIEHLVYTVIWYSLWKRWISHCFVSSLIMQELRAAGVVGKRDSRSLKATLCCSASCWRRRKEQPPYRAVYPCIHPLIYASVCLSHVPFWTYHKMRFAIIVACHGGLLNSCVWVCSIAALSPPFKLKQSLHC